MRMESPIHISKIKVVIESEKGTLECLFLYNLVAHMESLL